MGRTIPSFRIAIELEQNEWRLYQKYLSTDKRKLFRLMFSTARLYNSACSYCNNPVRLYPILLSIIFDLYNHTNNLIQLKIKIKKKMDMMIQQ